MAIYKPSNCTPFLNAVDLTKPFDISCEINTSNDLIKKYRIKILDNNNKIIFAGDIFDTIFIDGYSNTGVNGTILSLPLVVTDIAKQNGNNIFYSQVDKKWYVKNGNKQKDISNLFFNESVNQPYKWVIYLAQDDNDYDMTLSQGAVLGSTINRIQSALSEKIYKDYFIQLEGRQKRVLINSYDYTYGYIYPNENEITQEELDNSSYFEVYKYSNDPDVISAGSQVLLNTSKNMNNVMLAGAISSTKWGEKLVYPNYFKQTFSGLLNDYKEVPCNIFDSGFPDGNSMGEGTVIMVSKQGDSSFFSNAYNGIFMLQTLESVKDTNGTYTLTLTWLRSASADTWATLTNKVYYVQSGSDAGNRYQINADGISGVGVINSTPVMFEPEKPIEIYKEELVYENINYGKTKGPVFKNEVNDYSGKIYIKPYVGAYENIRISLLNDEDSIYKNINDITVNNKYWYIEYKTVSPLNINIIPDTTVYKITTFFKEGDEVPFYAKNAPEIIIKSEQWQENGQDDYVCNQRYIDFSGEIKNRKWVNFVWELTDLTNGSVQISNPTYYGEMRNTFYGLQNGHYYEITLTIEDEFGMSWSNSIVFNIQVEITKSEGKFTAEYECETQSVKLKYIIDGMAIPEPSVLIYEGYNVKIEEESSDIWPYMVTTIDGGTEYDDFYIVKFSDKLVGYTIAYNENGLFLSDINDDAAESNIPVQLIKYYQVQDFSDKGIIGNLSGPNDRSFTVNSEHVLNANFAGKVISYLVEDKKEGQKNSSVFEVAIEVPSAESYDELTGIYSVNENRNQLNVVISKSISNNKTITYKKPINLYYYDGNFWKEMPDNRWQTNNEVASAWGTADVKEPSVDYLEMTYAYVYDEFVGAQSITQYITIRGDGSYNSSKGKIGTILEKKSSDSGIYYSIWSDKKLKYVKQTSKGDPTNVQMNEYEIWDDADGWIWNDKNGSVELELQHKTTGQTGRQNIKNIDFTFNIAIEKYNEDILNEHFISNNVKAKAFLKNAQ